MLMINFSSINLRIITLTITVNFLSRHHYIHFNLEIIIFETRLIETQHMLYTAQLIFFP